MLDASELLGQTTEETARHAGVLLGGGHERPLAFDEHRRRLSKADGISEFLAGLVTVSGVGRKRPCARAHHCRQCVESVSLKCIAPNPAEMPTTLLSIERVHNRPEGERSEALH